MTITRSTYRLVSALVAAFLLSGCMLLNQRAEPTATSVPPTPTEGVVAAPTDAPTAVPTEPAAAPTDVPAQPTPLPDNPVEMPPDEAVVDLPAGDTPEVQLVTDFMLAFRAGLTTAGTDAYFTPALQQAVAGGRPLPSILGIRDLFAGLTIEPVDGAGDRARVRVRVEEEEPLFIIFTLRQLAGAWRIDSIAVHDLVRTLDTTDLVAAEDVVAAYYGALAADDTGGAFALLTERAREALSPDDLLATATGLESVHLSTIQPVRHRPDRLTFYVRLFAVPNAEQPGPWRAGDNARWVTMLRTADGWRIDEVQNSALLSEVTSWRRVSVLPLNLTLEIPADWLQPGVDWSWSPTPLGRPEVGVRWANLGPVWSDEQLLPARRRAISQQPIDLGWAQGQQYTYEIMGAPGEGAIAVQTNIVVLTHRRAYSFFGTADSVEELNALRPILQRAVAAVTLDDSGAYSYNGVETTLAFLSALLRDESGADSMIYLAEEIRDDFASRDDQLRFLESPALFRSFTAAWQETDETGLTRVLVTFRYADGSILTRQLLLAPGAEGQMLIVDSIAED